MNLKKKKKKYNIYEVQNSAEFNGVFFEQNILIIIQFIKNKI